MLKYIKYFSLIIFLCNFIYISKANTATINSASCSQSDVQAAVNSASDGDTVLVPPGNCTWTGLDQLTVTNLGIILQGAGEDVTTITDNTNTGTGNEAIVISLSSGDNFRLTGFTFKGSPGSEGIIKISGTSKTWRMDNLEFDGITSRVFWIAGYTYGVIDNCNFHGATPPNCILIDCDNDTAWTRALPVGNEKMVYIEDCTFNYSNANPGNGAIDCRAGGAYCARYNTLTNIAMANHGFCQLYRSGIWMEIYENTFHATDPNAFIPIGYIRGGTGYIYNNAFTDTATNWNGGMAITTYRTCQGAGTNLCSSYGRCDGNNPLDGNQDGTGYPCKDQIGRGTDQGLYPFYEYNNTLRGSDTDFQIINYGGCSNPAQADQIKNNRDYFDDTQMPGYTAYTYPHPLTGASAPPGAPPPPGDGPPAPPFQYPPRKVDEG